MSRRLQLASFLILWTAPAAHAQFELYLLNGTAETPANAVHNLGSFYQNEVAVARFRLRNASANPATLNVLAADGAGFGLSGVPPLPATLGARAALDFTVTFSSPATGTFSATLRSGGISTLLTAAVLPRLTYTLDGQPLGAETVGFGSIERGEIAVRQIGIENRTPLVLTVPAISVQGSAFALAGASPSGLPLQPLQTARFDIRFLAAAPGPHSGLLTIGDRTYVLAGVSTEPPLPKPSLTIDLPQSRSGQQGTLAVRLDADSRTSGSGVVTLEFRPLTSTATDPGIAFASGGLTIPFTLSPGDIQPLTAMFQTGTTAGNLIFTVSLGGVTERQTLTIPAETVAISSTVAERSPGSIEVRISGFDNTRSAGPAAYTFFDATGSSIPPGTIRVDSTADFSRFFQTSEAGGNFLLRAVFPVSGDGSRIAAFEAELTNSAGVARTARIPF